MQACATIFFPLVWTLNTSSRAILKVVGLKPPPPHARVHSEEELGIILDESHKAGMMSPEERKMLERVFQFHDKTVKEIMIPRPDITALSIRSTPKEVEKAVMGDGYSRLPVYDGNLDNVKGIVYVKDLIYPLQHPELIKLADLLREALFVPESYPVQKLLKDFQKARVHMAMVLDEFGATSGLVTLEDIVEEIVGEIQDEHDNEPAEVEKAGDGTVVFEGKASVDKLKEVFPDCELPAGEFDTVGGLVFHVAGHVPREGETFRVGNMVLRVAKREGRRLRKIAARVATGQTQVIRGNPDASETSSVPEPVDSKREAS
jgi:CBS domain containing-hemolysin-like protein